MIYELLTIRLSFSQTSSFLDMRGDLVDRVFLLSMRDQSPCKAII